MNTSRLLLVNVRKNVFHQSSRGLIYISKNTSSLNVEDVKNQIRLLRGGQVELYKDEETGIAQICFDHVEKKNCLSGEMMAEFHNAVCKLESWKTGKGLILHSKGDLFCSGGYLESIKALGKYEGGLKMSTLMQDAVIRLRNLPFISVAVVQGKALGGGAELTVATDFRLFTPSTELRFVQARMGLTTGWGGGINLKRLVGYRRTLDLMMTSRNINLEYAQSLGLVDGVIGHDSRLEEAKDWLDSRLRHLPVQIVQATKKNALSEDYDGERAAFSDVWGNDFHLSQLYKNPKHK